MARTDTQDAGAAETNVVSTGEELRQQRLTRFRQRIEQSKRGRIRVRITPQVYDAGKNVYVAWPDRAWVIEANTIEDVEPVLTLIHRVLDGYRKVGVQAVLTRLGSL